LTGPLETTNEWYAVAKIAGVKLCQAYHKQHGCDFISAMPTNLYGPGDNYDPATSHVLAALLLKAHEARCAGQRTLEIWGTGKPRREFLHVDDCADALVHLMAVYSGADHINIGSGSEVSIEDLAQIIMQVVGFDGAIEKDLTRPDGTPRKLMDGAQMAALGWTALISLEDGIRMTYAAAPFRTPGS
jgi:GDP-L-fucose synthase